MKSTTSFMRKQLLSQSILMASEIRLLDATLLSDDKKLKELSYWLRVMNRPNGWHYDFDHIWILNELEKNKILPGSTILDAGAGQGIMQYLLAARGYNIISLDFTPRTIPKRSIGIFDINGEGDSDITYQHPYMKLISYDRNFSARELVGRVNIVNLNKIPKLSQLIMRHIKSKLFHLHQKYVSNHAGYGTITYLRAPFHQVPLPSGSMDAVVSISAIEHGDIKLFHKNITELTRLLKPKAPLLLTTSASNSDEDTFHEKSSGWCFSLATLRASLSNCKIEFDIKSSTRSICDSDVFISRLDSYYHQDKRSFCYKKCIEALPYLPVSIKIINKN
jgi:ubiquinone/menaquinone biosynthesis C-methylase UbiE